MQGFVGAGPALNPITGLPAVTVSGCRGPQSLAQQGDDSITGRATTAHNQGSLAYCRNFRLECRAVEDQFIYLLFLLCPCFGVRPQGTAAVAGAHRYRQAICAVSSPPKEDG